MNPTDIKYAAEAAVERSQNAIATFANLAHKNVERLAGLQKATLDTFGTYTSDLNKTLRDSFKAEPPAAVQSVFELSEQTVQGWINAQKAIVDLITEQSAHVADVIQDRTIINRPVQVLCQLAERSAERTIDAQKTVLDLAASQNKAVSEAVRKQAAAAGQPWASATESLEKAVGQVIENQKELLDTGAKMLKTVTSNVEG
jgi:hypothetical protein